MPSNRVDDARIRTIEKVADRDRHVAAQRLVPLGVPLEWDTDMVLIAAVITNGDVTAWPNLSDSRGRVSGHLDWFNGCLRLRFEEFHPRARQRFSIAHELGHLALHVERDDYGNPVGARRHCAPPRVSADAEDPDELMAEDDPLDEREADAYAGAFLMPAPALVADVRQFGRASAFLSLRYGVSPAAARFRLRVLDRLALVDA